jgi:hypothetical protein
VVAEEVACFRDSMFEAGLPGQVVPLRSERKGDQQERLEQSPCTIGQHLVGKCAL